MSKTIKQYYRDRVKNGAHNSLLWQVGKTVNGKEVSKEQVQLIVDTIASRLKLDSNDIVLDTGSGNGLLTKEVAKLVCKVSGFELTPELCGVANKYNSGKNISYANCDVLKYNATKTDAPFTKVYAYEVMQHFSYRESDTFFSKLNEITTKDAVIFIGGILDIEKQWKFFDTMERRCNYFSALLSGSDPLGTWYHKDFFDCLAKTHNLHTECIEQESNLYTSHYRFDCLLRKQ